MATYDDDAMEICPPSPVGIFSRENSIIPNPRFSNRYTHEGSGIPACISPLCPITFPHASGQYLQNGKPPPEQARTVFGGSNPPKFCWMAYERCAGGIGTENDVRIVLAFRELHANRPHPWAWAAEEQRWTQLRQRLFQEEVVTDAIPSNRGRGGLRGHFNRGASIRAGPNRGAEHRGGGFRGGSNRGGEYGGGEHRVGEHRGGGFRGGSNRGGEHGDVRGAFRGGRGGRARGAPLNY